MGKYEAMIRRSPTEDQLLIGAPYLQTIDPAQARATLKEEYAHCLLETRS